jgi:hypothetical protein
MTLTPYKQTSTAPHGGPFGSTIIGTYNLHTNMHIIVTGIMNNIMDIVGTLNVTSGNPFPWTSTTITTTDGVPGTPGITNGTLAIPAGVWLFNIGSDYFIQVDDTFVLTKQP